MNKFNQTLIKNFNTANNIDKSIRQNFVDIQNKNNICSHNINMAWSYLQSGQAMVEAIVMLLVVASLWVGIAWLSKIQDIALNNANISSYAAFATSLNQDHETILQNSHILLNKQAQQWRNHDGSLMLKNSYQDLKLDWQRDDLSDDKIQIGMYNAHAKKLRQEWQTADPGILSVASSLSLKTDSTNEIVDDHATKLGLRFYLTNFPTITRHTSIATGAGYSYSDKDTANHIKQSTYAWSDAINNSYELGKKIESVASPVDGAWSRSKPVFDWLHPWEEMLPKHLDKK